MLISRLILVLGIIGTYTYSSCAACHVERPDIVIADFEGRDWGGWTATGKAFGDAPARGTLPGQMAVSGYKGTGLVNSFVGGDASTGKLISPEFSIVRRYINFLIGGGMHPGFTCINLTVDGKVAKTATGPNGKPGGSEMLDWRTWDVSDLENKSARLEIVDMATGGWGHINVDQITMSDDKMQEPIRTDKLYDETYRPQFHFTPAKGWTNDPNGLVYYKGEYHLFFQHNPFGTEWGNMTWGHAVSKDMVHWRQLPNAIEPDSLGTIFSGSAVVDHDNSLGLSKGMDKTLVAIYTAAGGTSPESKGQPFTQCIAYSVDRGNTWTKYNQNPVMKHIVAENRDPKVVWHHESRKWIMALYLDGENYGLFTSPNLKEWTQIQTIIMPGCGECPDFFEIPLANDKVNTKWIFTAANGKYYVGNFDGRSFIPEGGPYTVDYGANYYAVQTFSDIPASDGRRIQMAWMTGGSYPGMPFNQQMSFPCELSLHSTPQGLRLYRWPVREIASLYIIRRNLRLVGLRPGENPLRVPNSETYDIECEIEVKDASVVGFKVRGESVVYNVKDKTISCLGKTAPLDLENGRVKIRILVDRTSMEVFGNGGAVSMTSCFLPKQKELSASAFSEGGTARIISLQARTMKSAWIEAPQH